MRLPRCFHPAQRCDCAGRARSATPTSKYAESKDRRYRRIINDNNLPYGYKSLCMDTLGAFGTSLWSVIDRATDPSTHPKASGDYDPERH